jgi:uncharacterized membrane protein YhhN
METVVIGCAITGVALPLLLAAEHATSRFGVWIAKPIASSGFLIAGASRAEGSGAYSVSILLALALSMVGDIFLIPRSKTSFLVGLGAFLLAHVAYAAAFAQRGIDPLAALVALAAIASSSALVLRWLSPHLEPRMKGPVFGYILAITTMVALAAGTTAHDGNRFIVPAALAFYASDLAVARNRFVRASFSNKIWGLPLYYGAQLLFALSISS